MKSTQLKILSLMLFLSMGQMLFAGELCQGRCAHQKTLFKKSSNEHSCHKSHAPRGDQVQKQACGDMGRCYLLGELEDEPVLPVSQEVSTLSVDQAVVFITLYDHALSGRLPARSYLLSRPPPGLQTGRALLLQKVSFLI